METMGVMGFFALPMGVGDYVNVRNCILQMPKDALTYIDGMHSYWFTEDC